MHLLRKSHTPQNRHIALSPLSHVSFFFQCTYTCGTCTNHTLQSADLQNTTLEPIARPVTNIYVRMYMQWYKICMLHVC